MTEKILNLILALTFINIIACQHPDQELFTQTHWLVTEVNDSIVNTTIGLYFEKGAEMTYRQSANSCGGQYSLNEEQLSIQLKYCTEMCCDDELSGEIEDIITPKVDYKIAGEKLTLTSPKGQVVLTQQKQ